jgi:hypothetical protein
MVQRVVAGLFQSNGKSSHLSRGSDLRFFTGEVPEEVPAVTALPDSVPDARYSRMPEQDLAIWTVAELFAALGRAITGVLKPAELRAVRIRDNDHA